MSGVAPWHRVGPPSSTPWSRAVNQSKCRIRHLQASSLPFGEAPGKMSQNRRFRPWNWRDGDGKLQSAAQKPAGRHFSGGACCFWRPARIRAQAPARANCRSGSRKFRRKSMPRVSSLAARWLAIPALLLLPAVAGAAPVEPPAIAGVPIDFVLFALTLIGVALFHRHTLPIAVGGMIVISLFKIAFSPFTEGPGVAGWLDHLGHEWVLLTNLLGLLLGFALLSKHFEASRIPQWLPKLLPNDWKGGLVLLFMIFVLSSFLDNIAAALIGDTTTTMMWIDGVNPLQVLEAYVAAGTAMLVFGIPAAIQQQRYSPITREAPVGVVIDWARVFIVALILITAIVVNVVINVRYNDIAGDFPFIGAAVWVALLVCVP